MRAMGTYNWKAVTIELDWDCIRLTPARKKDKTFEIPYSDIVEAKRFKGLEKGIKIKTTTNKYKITVENASTKEMLQKIKDYLDNVNMKMFREYESESEKKEKKDFLSKFNSMDKNYFNRNEVSKYIEAFIKKAKYGYNIGDIDKFRDLLTLKGNPFTENQIMWLIEHELVRQDYEDFKLKVVRDNFNDFDNHAIYFLDVYGDNYNEYIGFFVEMLAEKGIPIPDTEIENKLEEIKKHSELLDLEKSIMDFDENSHEFTDENNFNPEESKIWFNKGNIYYDLRDANEAIWCYNNALELDPVKNLPALNMKWLILHNLGNFNAAAACYNKALHIDSNNPESWNNMGILLFDIGQMQKAAVCYNMASRVQHGAKTFSSLNKSLKLIGKVPKAISIYQSFMEQSASDPSALIGSRPFHVCRYGSCSYCRC